MVTRSDETSFSEASIRRERVWSLRLGSSENQITTAPGSASNPNVSLP